MGTTDQVVVRVQTTPAFSTSNPVPAVEGGLPLLELGVSRPYDVTRDGRKFLTVAPPAAAARSDLVDTGEIEIVLNWFEQVRRLAPPK